MDQTDIEALCRMLLEQARDVFLETGESPHSIVALPKGWPEPLIIDLDMFPSASWPDVRQAIEAGGALEWIAHVSAAWMKKVSIEEAHAMRERGEQFKPPSEYPDAKQVFLSEVKAGSIFVVMSQECERNEGGEWVLGELHNMSDADGHYSRVMGVGEPPTQETIDAITERYR